MKTNVEYSDFERLCASKVGKKIQVNFRDSHNPIIGKCIGYVPAVDNDPEVASIDVETDEGLCFDLDEDEILSITDV